MMNLCLFPFGQDLILLRGLSPSQREGYQRYMSPNKTFQKQKKYRKNLRE